MIPSVNNPKTISDYSCWALPVGFFSFAGKLASLSRIFFDYFSKCTHDFQPRTMLPKMTRLGFTPRSIQTTKRQKAVSGKGMNGDSTGVQAPFTEGSELTVDQPRGEKKEQGQFQSLGPMPAHPIL